MRWYIRLDPRMVEKKLKAGYTMAQIGAYAMLLTQAEQQPERGWFKSMGLLREAMDCMVEECGTRARCSQYLAFLFDRKDVAKIDGRYYVEGWEEWQEGDHSPKERMELVRGRRGRPGDPESPGARRQARYRAKQTPAATGGDGDVTSQIAGTSDVTNSAPSDASHGETVCDERHVARDLDVSISRRHIAVSTDGGDASPDGDGDAAGAVRAGKKPTGPPMSAEAVALIQGYQELGYAQPSGTDMLKAGEFVAELRYLAVTEMLARMREHLAWCDRERKPRPQTLGGFWNTLRAENDFRRDGGAQAQAGGSGPRVDGLQRIDVGGMLRVEPGGLAP